METEDISIVASLLCKSYRVDGVEIEVLKDTNLDVENGEFVAISGDSGSGKTTLLNIISGIDKPTSGSIIVFGEDLGDKNEDFLAAFRCRKIGYVFQTYNLVSTLTVEENVAFPMEWLRKPTNYVENRVLELLATVGLVQRSDHFPHQLSGGEQQRVAFARALSNDPPLLLIDEPTGNLDPKTALNIIDILRKLKDYSKTIVVATHDERIFSIADQRMHLRDGKLASEYE